MQAFKIGELCSILGATGHNVKADQEVHFVSTDSRQPMAKQTLFFALVGTNYDGHNYLPEQDESSSIVAVVSKPVDNYPHLLVSNTTTALQKLARFHRLRYDGKLVAITGSHGKTITKELAASMLAPNYRVYKSPGSYNSQIGVALSLLEMPLDTEIAFIELGVSKFDEMDTLVEITRPTHSIITSIGNAHLEGFNGSLDAIASEKLKLSDASSVLSILPDTVLIDSRCVKLGSLSVFHVKHSGNRSIPTVFTDYLATDVQVGQERVDFKIEKLEKREGEWTSNIIADAHLHCPGEYNVGNVVAAAAIADLLGGRPEKIEEAIANFEPAPMRLEIHTTRSGIVILNDAYISDPTSARRAIDSLVHYSAHRRSIAILGDMGDVGERSQIEHRELGKYASQAGVSVIVAVGKHCREIIGGAIEAKHLRENLRMFETIEELDEALPKLLTRDDVVLFKGRRALALEEAAAKLLEPVAPTRLEVSLKALTANVAAVRRQVGHDVKIMAIVKSYAYGSDATKISKALTRHAVEWFAVAYPDEAIPLRDAGITDPILVMNVLAGEAEKFTKYDLTALVSDVETVRALGRAGRRVGQTIPIHLEIDTGMHRLGMTLEDTERITRRINHITGVTITGVMTHFVAADDQEEDEFTKWQITQFNAGVRRIEAIVGRRLLRHAANTAATWRFPEAHFDMIRLGIGLYGISPSNEVSREASMDHALRFVTKVLRVHTVHVGETVGYNRRWCASRETEVATIAVGYNDGFHRFMSNGGVVLIHGCRCPVIGMVCMDVCTVDVTGVGDVRVGDEVVLFGRQTYRRGNLLYDDELPVLQMALLGNTICYEILTGISSRVRRILIDND